MDQSYVLEEKKIVTHIDDGRIFLPKTEFFKKERKKEKFHYFLHILSRRHLSAYTLMLVSLQDILHLISRVQNIFFTEISRNLGLKLSRKAPTGRCFSKKICI